ncbi:hypothetical protein AKJ08_1662 [Vulgatibacter incomptus]|uniref:L-seryl-tRNA(Sec) selenium transferase n=1 Tax=Vulgatibacter incomptus TaxID=1391653 RepID=A0A0K1PCN3_9BACT|nr:hypothetical protein AKJ08_1662 [Vulgatibacter incomptus]
MIDATGRSRQGPDRASPDQSAGAPEARAIRLQRLLTERGLTAAIAPGSTAVAILGDAPALQHRLLEGTPPVIARMEGGRLLLDVRTIREEELEALAEAVRIARRKDLALMV